MPAVAAAVALVIALPAGANSIPTTGSRIPFFVSPATYPANTPFYVEQWEVCYRNATTADCTNSGTFFVLSVRTFTGDFYLNGILTEEDRITVNFT